MLNTIIESLFIKRSSGNDRPPSERTSLVVERLEPRMVLDGSVSNMVDLGNVTETSRLVQDEIAMASEQDHYQVFVSADRRLRVAISADEIGTGLDAVLVVRDASGRTVAIDDDTLGLDPYIEADLAAGQYTITVLATARSTGRYQLSVSTGAVGQFLGGPNTPPVAQLPGSGDSTGPIVIDQSVETVIDGNGDAVALRWTFTFNESLAAINTASLAGFQLYRAGGDHTFGDANETQVALPNLTISQSGALLTVVAWLNASDDYQLVIDSSRLTDLQGNEAPGGGLIAAGTFHPSVATIADVEAAHFLASETPNRVIVSLAAGDQLNANTLTADRFQLTRLADGQAIRVSEVHYDPLGERIILSGFGTLAVGHYQLTIDAAGFSDIWGRSLAPDGVPFSDLFTVVAPTGFTEPTVNTALLSANARELSRLHNQLQFAATDAAKLLASRAFAESLLNTIAELRTLGPQATANALASLLNSIPGVSEDYALVWGTGARFLLESTTSDAVIGQDGSGFRLDAITGSVFVTSGTGANAVSLAIVPVSAFRSTVATGPLTDSAGQAIESSVGLRLKIQSLAASGSVHVLFLDESSTLGLQSFVASPSLQTVSVNVPEAITPFDRITPQLQSAIVARMEQLAGDLTALGTNVVIVWFDPVDFMLTDAQGQTAVATESQLSNDFVGAYYSGNGVTELVVVPQASAEVWRMQLVGLGERFRTGVTFASPDLAGQITIQGNLGWGANQGFLLLNVPSPTTNPASPPTFALNFSTATRIGSLNNVAIIQQTIAAVVPSVNVSGSILSAALSGFNALLPSQFRESLLSPGLSITDPGLEEDESADELRLDDGADERWWRDLLDLAGEWLRDAPMDTEGMDELMEAWRDARREIDQAQEAPEAEEQPAAEDAGTKPGASATPANAPASVVTTSEALPEAQALAAPTS